MDNFDFSEEEIQEQLAILGYKNIPKHRLRQFKQELDELIQNGEWTAPASSSQRTSRRYHSATSQHSPPAYTKEKVSRCQLKESGEGFFLHTAKADKDRRVLPTFQNMDYRRQSGPGDSYAKHSVTQKPQLPLGAPSCLQVESDLEDTLSPPLTDSYTSSPDTQGRRFIKRKVLRKHQGQSLVRDESVYSEDSASTDHTYQQDSESTMYKMYNSQLDEESDDDSASFWSDTEKQDKNKNKNKKDDEDEDKVERSTEEEESRPVVEAGDSLQKKATEREEPELIYRIDSDRQSLGDETTNDDDDESFSSGSESSAQSLMTSGYGTYRPEEHEGGGFRDDHTVVELDQDSRGDLSETRDAEDDDRSLCSFGGFDVESMREPDNRSEAIVAGCGDDGQQHKDMNLEEDGSTAKSENVTDEEPEEKRIVSVAQDESLIKVNPVNDVCDPEEAEQREDAQQELEEQEDGDKEADSTVELEDPESLSNKDIRFIDSTVDFSWRMYDKMCEEWEGNLRRRKGKWRDKTLKDVKMHLNATSCLEERLADLHLSTSAQNEDETSQSDVYSTEGEEVPLSAFESYLQGMTRSVGDLRPKPKSFIRPVMSQQSIRKSDPVAKYFQYKQLWEMFKLPGEKDRRALRWEIREQLAYQPPPPKPRRVYVPNTYVVPTEKKRSALRWEVRNDLANGLLPHKFTYRY